MKKVQPYLLQIHANNVGVSNEKINAHSLNQRVPNWPPRGQGKIQGRGDRKGGRRYQKYVRDDDEGEEKNISADGTGRTVTRKKVYELIGNTKHGTRRRAMIVSAARHGTQ